MSAATTQSVEASRKAKQFFDDLWRQGDYWNLESSEFEQQKYERQIAYLEGRHYARVLEIGCGTGAFTRRLTGLADYVLGIDVAPSAIERAITSTAAGTPAEFRVANIMDHDLRQDAPWDLIVMSETICYLGWLYSFFQVSWLASEMFRATRAGGQLLMANTFGGPEYLLQPFIIRTYRDLFLNAAYELAAEEIFRGVKQGVSRDVLITLFVKPPAGSTSAERSI